MADEKPTENGPARMEVEIARPKSYSADPQTGEQSVTSTESTTADFDVSGGLGPEEDEAEGTTATKQEPEAADEPEQKDEPSEGDLPEYKGDDEEVRSKYDERYFTPEGTVNLPVLSQEFFTNLEKGGEGKLNAGTYAYLKDSLGLDEAAVKEIERGQMALREQTQSAFYGTIEGGKEAYEAAVAWGVGGGYTDAQKAAYNEAQAKGGVAFQDAVEALMARYRKANGGSASSTPRRGPPPKRQSTPGRDVTGGSRAPAGGGGGERYATSAEHQQAWTKALADVSEAKKTGDRAAIRAAEQAREEVRAKGRRGFGRG